MEFEIKNKIWRYSSGKASWFFVDIDAEVGEQIKFLNSRQVGWGSVKVKATIGETGWTTSVFPKKGGGYLLPVKKEVRRKEKIKEGDVVRVRLDLVYMGM